MALTQKREAEIRELAERSGQCPAALRDILRAYDAQRWGIEALAVEMEGSGSRESEGLAQRLRQLLVP